MCNKTNEVKDYSLEIDGVEYKLPLPVFKVLKATSEERDILREEIKHLGFLNLKWCKQRVVFFAAEIVYNTLNPKSKMDIPSSVYERMDKEFDKWVDSKKK